MKRKRIPRALLLAVLTAALCAALASCRGGEEAGTALEMDTQYYDVFGNCVEIPQLTAPVGELPADAAAINQELLALKAQYQGIMDIPENTVGDNLCLFYPAVTERYYNLVFYLGDSSYGSDGDIVSWVYDRQEDRRVTMEDALALAGVTRGNVLEGQGLSGLEGCGKSLLGFRVRPDGGVVFYLSCTQPPDDIMDGWRSLYIWEDGTYTRYDTMLFAPEVVWPLVDAEDTQPMAPPLWCQWRFDGGEPEGGFLRAHAPAPVVEAAKAYLASHPAAPGAAVEWDGDLWLHTAYDDLSGLDLAPAWDGKWEAVECYSLSYRETWTEDGEQRNEYLSTDLAFLRAGEAYTYLGDFSNDNADSEPGRLAAAAPYNFKVLNLLLEQGLLEGLPDMEAMLRDNPAPAGARSSALAWFYGQAAAERGERVYFAAAAPFTPALGDRRIDAMEFAGLAVTYETYGVAYRVTSSGYQSANGAEAWQTYAPIYLVLGLGQDGSFGEVRGEADEEEDVERAILEASYDLMDLDAALWRDGWPWPAGPGSRVAFFREEPEITALEGWEPIYAQGDQWRRYDWEGFTALCYCSADGGCAVKRAETDRADLSTWRNIRVGDTRASLEAAYPGLTEDADEADCLRWDCDPHGWGPFLQFYLEGDTVGRIAVDYVLD